MLINFYGKRYFMLETQKVKLYILILDHLNLNATTISETLEEEELLVEIEIFPLKFHYSEHVLLSFEC